MKLQDLKREDRSVLTDFYESPEYKSLRTVMEQLSQEWRYDALNVQSMEDLRELRGRIAGLTNLTDLLKKNHKENVKKSVSLIS